MGIVPRLLYWFVWALSWAVFKTYFRQRVEGAPRTWPSGPLVVAANHCSYLDPLALAVSIPRRIVFLVTSDHYYKPYIRPWMWMLGCLPVQEDRSNRDTIRAALDELRDGCVVGIFPEGGISDDGRLREGRNGVSSLILQGQARVLPVALVGPFESLPRGGVFPKPVLMRTRFGPLLDAVEVVAGQRGNPARTALRDRIMSEIAEMLPEHQRRLPQEVSEVAP